MIEIFLLVLSVFMSVFWIVDCLAIAAHNENRLLVALEGEQEVAPWVPIAGMVSYAYIVAFVLVKVYS